MTMKTALVALALTVAPTLAIAECSWGAKMTETHASICGEGQTYNETLGTCVTLPTS